MAVRRRVMCNKPSSPQADQPFRGEAGVAVRMPSPILACQASSGNGGMGESLIIYNGDIVRVFRREKTAEGGWHRIRG